MMDILFGDYVPPRDKELLVDLFVKTDDGTEMTLEDAKAANVLCRTLILKPKQELKKNRNYYVVTDGLKSQAGLTAKTVEQSIFSTVYAPLYAQPSELRAILKSLFNAFPITDMYVALRDAAIKAHQMKGLKQDANDSRFRPVLERDDIFYPMTRFTVYEAARILLSRLMMELVDQQGINEGGASNGGTIMGDSVKLGDFSIGASSGGSTSTTTSATSSSPAALIRSALDQITADLRFWTDAMMGRNARGYASAVAAQFRTSAGSPPSRGLDT